MAISVVVAVGGVADPLVAAIAARIPDVVIGPGDEPVSMMGPLITPEHRDRVRSYVAGAEDEGAIALAKKASGAATVASTARKRREVSLAAISERLIRPPLGVPLPWRDPWLW